MKKILISASIIAAVAAVVVGGTIAYFSDTETSTGNTFTAGTIDISVAGQNPWNRAYPMLLDKPCETNYINFDIRNVGENPANVWKRINNVQTNGGASIYPIGAPVASSEPEWQEGTNNGKTLPYVERDNLAAYMIYDMYICHGVVGPECPVEGDDPTTGKPVLTDTSKWIPIIPAANQVRIDNVNGVWIKLDEALAKGGALAVSQSYHLMAWDDAGEETITNWAQGDVMTFDIELEARQIGAPAPGISQFATLNLVEKDPTTWEPVVSGASGVLTFETAKDTFDYTFSATGLEISTAYSLIYYADDWPGNHPGALIGTMMTDTSGDVNTNGNPNLGMDLPDSADANYPAGAKIQLVLTTDYDGTKMIGWHPSEYLFEMNLIKYEDTNN